MQVFKEFQKARKFVNSLNLKTRKEWYQYINGNYTNLPKLPLDIPKSPYHIYRKKGWVSWGNWLGTGYISVQKRKYREFNEAKKFSRSLKLKSVKEWWSYCKGLITNKPALPIDIPSDAYRIYKNKGWVNWADWLGY